MPSVFISYTRSDSWYANKLYQHLHSFRVNDGGEVFLDRRDIAGGELWRAELDQAIAASDAVVLMLSSDYFASSFCYEQELPAIARQYVARGVKVLPVLVKSVEWEDYGFGDVHLGDVNAIGPFDASNRLIPLAEFPAAIQERKFTELAEQIERAVLGRPARAQPIGAPEAVASGAGVAEPERRPLLRWLSGAAAAATVVAVAIQIVQMSAPEETPQPGNGPPLVATTTGTPPPPDGIPGECLRLDVRSPQILPSNLIESIDQQESFPYWFRLQGANECERSVHLAISFKLRAGPFVLEDREPWVHTLASGQTINTNLAPQIDITNDILRENEEHLEINLVAQDGNEILIQETHKILILARPVIVWDLRDPAGVRVAPEFTLASLAAWTKISSAELQEAARECRGHSASSQARDPETWVPRCYALLFDDRIVVNHDVFPINALFSRDGRQSILPADDVLHNGEATPLEATLALGAIGRVGLEDRRTDIGMLAVRDGDTQPALYFVWSKDRGPWSGVALADATTLSYAQNRSQADPLIRTLFDENPAIAAALRSTKGVYIGDAGGVVGINFRLAAEHFSIAGLP